MAAATAHWMSDASTTHCSGCKVKFDMVNRKHHCRLCGHIFCDDCSRWRINVAELGIADGRSCEPCHVWLNQKLPLLQREAIFQKIDSDGSDHEVRLRISRDQELIQWKSAKFQFGVTEQLELDDFRTVVVGQQTDAFSSAHTWFFVTCCLGNSIQRYEDRSFSLVLADNQTLDLIALSVDAMDGWLDAFREMIARRKSASSAAIKDSVRRQQAAAEQQTKSEIRSKYANMNSKLKTKYGSVN